MQAKTCICYISPFFCKPSRPDSTKIGRHPTQQLRLWLVIVFDATRISGLYGPCDMLRCSVLLIHGGLASTDTVKVPDPEDLRVVTCSICSHPATPRAKRLRSVWSRTSSMFSPEQLAVRRLACTIVPATGLMSGHVQAGTHNASERHMLVLSTFS